MEKPKNLALALYVFMLLTVAVLTLGFTIGFAQTNLDGILKNGIKTEVYPGVAAMAGWANGTIIYSAGFGTYEYLANNSNSPSIDVKTSIFDLASVTKVIATTTAVALLYQMDLIRLDDKIGDLLNDANYFQNGKNNVTVRNCLLHNAGYNPDPDPNYYETDFGCPNTADYYPPEDFSCIDKVYNSLLSESLASEPGSTYVYSDLSFITLLFVVGSVVYKNNIISPDSLLPQCQNITNQSIEYILNCYFEAFVRKYAFQEAKAWLPNTSYLPPLSKQSICVVTNNDTSYRHTLNQGNVSDSNCYAMGGICGHAGLFASTPDLGRFATRMLYLATSPDNTTIDAVTDTNTNNVIANDIEVEGNKRWLNATTVKLFIKEYNQTQSSRAFGWTTNDPVVSDYGFNNSCGTMSTVTFMHIGYTGTCICMDPVNKIWSVILTNRVYNGGSSDAVKAMYQEFNTELMDLVFGNNNSQVIDKY